MKITKEILESTILEMAKVVLPPYVDEDYDIESKEPYELYNALVGTTFDEEGYNKVVEDAPDYLYMHIPGGAKVTTDAAETVDLTGDDKVDEEDLAVIDELLEKLKEGTITYEEIKKGDVSGDFKLTDEDRKLIYEEVQRQKKSQVTVDTDEDEETEPTEVESDSYDYIYDEESWNNSYQNGALHIYYTANPNEDLWNESEHRAANFNDRHYVGTIDNEEVECGAQWASDNAQSLVIGGVTYYTEIFYDLNPRECELFTDVALTESANKTLVITSITYANCVQCWEGAINAPGAAYPWIAPYFDTDVNAKIRFEYEGLDPVYPWGDTIFGNGEGHKVWGAASIPTELGEEFKLVNGETTFDVSKFKMILVH